MEKLPLQAPFFSGYTTNHFPFPKLHAVLWLRSSSTDHSWSAVRLLQIPLRYCYQGNLCETKRTHFLPGPHRTSSRNSNVLFLFLIICSRNNSGTHRGPVVTNP